MKDIIHSTAALFLGVIIGVLGSALAVVSGLLYMANSNLEWDRKTEEKKVPKEITALLDPNNHPLSIENVDEIIKELNTLVEKYGQASVSDYRTLLGLSDNFLSTKWGWKAPIIPNIIPVMQNTKFTISFPEPVAL
jgi:hypothetical protein